MFYEELIRDQIRNMLILVGGFIIETGKEKCLGSEAYKSGNRNEHVQERIQSDVA